MISPKQKELPDGGAQFANQGVGEHAAIVTPTGAAKLDVKAGAAALHFTSSPCASNSAKSLAARIGYLERLKKAGHPHSSKYRRQLESNIRKEQKRLAKKGGAK